MVKPHYVNWPKRAGRRVGESTNLDAEIPANLNNFRQKTKQSTAVGIQESALEEPPPSTRIRKFK